MLNQQKYFQRQNKKGVKEEGETTKVAKTLPSLNYNSYQVLGCSFD